MNTPGSPTGAPGWVPPRIETCSFTEGRFAPSSIVTTPPGWMSNSTPRAAHRVCLLDRRAQRALAPRLLVVDVAGLILEIEVARIAGVVDHQARVRVLACDQLLAGLGIGDRVVAGPAVETVVARAAGEDVVTAVAGQVVGTSPPGHSVGLVSPARSLAASSPRTVCGIAESNVPKGRTEAFSKFCSVTGETLLPVAVPA